MLLRKKLGAEANEILTDARLESTKHHFEYYIKRQFNPLDKDCQAAFEIPLRAARDMPEKGLIAGYLKLTRSPPPQGPGKLSLILEMISKPSSILFSLRYHDLFKNNFSKFPLELTLKPM